MTDTFPARSSAALCCTALLLYAGLLSAADHRVHPAKSPVEIDGSLEEPAWEHALRLELKYEVRPGENTDPPVRTEMMITYDENRLLVAFICHDPEPEQIRARYNDRDSAWSDDWVGVVIDTFNDQRRAYELYVNPFGVQIDAIHDEVTGSYDADWNAIWSSAGTITSSGWQVEMAIPFNQIRFEASEGPQTWGIDGVRSYPRTVRHQMGLFPRDRSNNSYLSQTIKIQGFEGIKPSEDVEIVPTFTAQRTEGRADFPQGDLHELDSNAEAGLNLRWGVTPNISLNGTINPDFSQVEADSVQLDINTTFALFFPETRPFFLESADYFNTPLMNLLHTRQIADPIGAAKVTGKNGSHTYGALLGRDEITNIIVPGPEGSSSGSFADDNTSAALRYRYNIGGSSTIGTMFTSRQTGDYHNRLVNLDGRFRMNQYNSLQWNVAASQTQYSAAMAEDLGQTTEVFSDLAFELDYDFSTRNTFAFAEYVQYGEDFRADLGFVSQADYRRWETGAGYRWIGSSEHWYSSMLITSNYDQTETLDGRLLERELEAFFQHNGPFQSEQSIGIGGRNRRFQGVEYDQLFWNIIHSMRINSDIFYYLFYRENDWIDFAHNREADQKLFFANLALNIGRHIFGEFEYEHQSLDVADGRLFTTSVLESSIVYNINARAFFRAILQYVDIDRDTSLYAFDVDETTQDFFTQLLFSYKVNPQTVLFLGYTDDFLGTEHFDLSRTQRTFFIKLSYAWLK